MLAASDPTSFLLSSSSLQSLSLFAAAAGDNNSNNAADDGGLRCTVSLPPLPREAKGPIYLAYELTRFHQNHRRYVRSRSEAQLRGDEKKAGKKKTKTAAATTTSTCAPREFSTATTAANESSAAASVIVPCGLVAWSNFNDSFSLEAVIVSPATGNSTTTALSLDAAPLRSTADLRGRFSPLVFPSSAPSFNGDHATRGGGALPANVSLADAAALQVWMRPAALPSFRKPAGLVVSVAGGDDSSGGDKKPLSSLPAGAVVRVTIANRFNSYRYGGTKSVVLTTESWLGGKNPFLGWSCVGVGCGCVASAAALAALAATEARKKKREAEEEERQR